MDNVLKAREVELLLSAERSIRGIQMNRRNAQVIDSLVARMLLKDDSANGRWYIITDKGMRMTAPHLDAEQMAIRAGALMPERETNEDEYSGPVDEYGQRLRDSKCPQCHGTGQLWDGPEPCPHCDGEGYEWWG